MDAAGDSNPGVPTSLFNTILTVVDHGDNAAGSVNHVYPLGTHTSLEAAKDFSRKALQSLGYSPSDFTSYEERPKAPGSDAEAWPHGDGTMVYAKRTGPHDFIVGIATTPNNENLPADPSNPTQLALPGGTDHLHYVMQSKVDYNAVRADAAQSTEIEGIYTKRADALAAAKACLLDEDVRPEDFAEYDESDSPAFKNEWPFGEDVVVHAVAQTGENYTVAVRTVVGSRTKHARYTKLAKE